MKVIRKVMNMGNKIFVSYKYADDQVRNLEVGKNSTVRDYIDEFEKKLDVSDNIYKGESDGEDLSNLSDETIWNKLKDRIYDSAITIVFISRNMKEKSKAERNQWIPWEVSYSLKETSRKNKNGDSITSHSNAMLAVVLPDIDNSYSYYLESKNCCTSKCTIHHTNKLFEVIRKNKFNKKEATKRICNNDDTIWTGTCSYIEAVRWSDFMNNYQKYVNSAIDRQNCIDDFEIYKEI